MIEAPAVPDGTTSRSPARRPWAALLVSALDGLVVVALPFALLAVVALIGWGTLGGAADWTAAVRAAAVTWLLGHGVDVDFTAGSVRFPVTAAPLGPALVTAVAGFAAGRRAARTLRPLAALVAGVVVVVAAAAVIVRLGAGPGVAPTAWQGIVLPAVLVAVAGLAGLRSGRDARPLPPGVRAGIAAVLLVVVVAAIAVATMIALHLPEAVGVTESLGAGGAGALVLTAAQLVALPTLVVWAASWFLGAGFAVGAGTAFGPLGTTAGALPAVPALASLPTAPPAWAVVALAVPILAGVVAGLLSGRASPRARVLPTALVAGVVAALLLGGLAAAASGSAGPGRFASVGPDAGLVAALALLETASGVAIGVAIGARSRAARPGRSYLDEVRVPADR